MRSPTLELEADIANLLKHVELVRELNLGARAHAAAVSERLRELSCASQELIRAMPALHKRTRPKTPRV